MDETCKAILVVWGMGCENCATRLRNRLLSLNGVHCVDVYLDMALAEISYDNERISADQLVAAVIRAGNDGRHRYSAELIASE